MSSSQVALAVSILALGVAVAGFLRRQPEENVSELKATVSALEDRVETVGIQNAAYLAKALREPPAPAQDPETDSEFPYPSEGSESPSTGSESPSTGSEPPSEALSANPQDKIGKLIEHAEAGNARAKVNLAYHYREGIDIPKDPRAAAELLVEAVCLDLPAGADGLGWLYLQGLGVDQSDQQAERLFRRAAERGHTHSMEHLGWLILQGRASPSLSPRDAYFWLSLAAERGRDPAWGMLDRIKPQLSLAEQREADQRVVEWVPESTAIEWQCE